MNVRTEYLDKTMRAGSLGTSNAFRLKNPTTQKYKIHQCEVWSFDLTGLIAGFRGIDRNVNTGLSTRLLM